MRNQLLLLFLINLSMHQYASAQNNFHPIEKGENYFYKKVISRGSEQILFTIPYKNNSHFMDVFADDGSYFSIRKPQFINSAARPFYYSKDSSNVITTGWVYPKTDSFYIITTSYDPFEGVHELIQKKTVLGLLGVAISTNIRKHKDHDYVMLSIMESGTVAHKIMLLKLDNDGMFDIVISKDRPSGMVISEGLFLLVHVVDFEILSDTRILLRGDVVTGIALADFNLDFIDNKAGGYYVVDKAEYYLSNNFGWAQMGIKEYWVFGQEANVVRNRGDANMIKYNVNIELDTIITDTMYLFANPSDQSIISGSSVKMGNQDAMICVNPEYVGSRIKTSIPSELIFKRIINKKESWQKKYQSENFIRVTDMVLVDSCKVMIVGRIFDYFDNDYLQGFYATFDCDGDLITSNIDLKEVDLNVFPNPSDGMVTVEVKEFQDLDYSVFTVDGKLVQSGMLDGQKANLSNLTSGTYVLSISTLEGIVNHKIVIAN